MSTENKNNRSGPFLVEGDNEATRLARLALLLGQSDQAPAGDRPSAEELWDWMHGAVTSERAEQILSHIAKDSDTYEQWHEMRLTQQEFNTEGEQAAIGELEDENFADAVSSTFGGAALGDDKQSEETHSSSHSTRGLESSDRGAISWLTKISALLKPSPYSGGLVLAAVLGGVIAINLNQTQPVDVWADWQSPKSFDGADVLSDHEEVSSVLAGIGNRLSELSVPVLGPSGNDLPSSIPQCQGNSDACSTRRQALFNLGELAIRARVMCFTNLDLPTGLLDEVVEIRNTLQGDKLADRFTGVLNSWASSNRRKVQCASANQIIAQALKGIQS